MPAGTRVEVAKVDKGAGVGTALINETLATKLASLTTAIVAVKKRLNGLTDLMVQKTKSL